MSCNGCRILRKGCSENCILRQSLRGIESPQAQANATVFVAKFFGRAGLMSFLSSVADSQRPDLFQSLLYEACGRTVNPVNGAVGLLWTGNWHVCQAAVETVLSGGVLRPSPEFSGEDVSPEVDDHASEQTNGVRSFRLQEKPMITDFDDMANNLNLGLTAGLPARMTAGARVKRRAATPSEESETTTLESGFVYHHDPHQSLQGRGEEKKLLRLFF